MRRKKASSASQASRRGRKAAHGASVASFRVRGIASSMLFQSTALAGTLTGVGVYTRYYSRAYAQAACTPSDTSNYINDGGTIASTTFSCTISSDDPVTTPQYAYGGSPTFYQNDNTYYGSPYSSPAYHPQPGLNITITNTAVLDVTEGDQQVAPMISFDAPNGTLFYSSHHSDAIGVVSVGSSSYDGGGNHTDKIHGGPGGTVSVVNTGEIKGSPRHGIYAVSAGGISYGTYSGPGGAVSVQSSADISADGFGIVAISRGGGAWGDVTAGAGDTVSVTVTGDVQSITSTKAGGGVFAASYGGNSPNNIAWNNAEGSTGGDAGKVSLTLGSSDTAFAGTVSTTAPGEIGDDWTFFTRSTGAALAAISYGGQGTYIAASADGHDGGNGGEVDLTVTGSSATTITTTGDHSDGALAMSYGGSSLNYLNSSKAGGSAGKVTLGLTGGGNVTTAGQASSALVAGSLGGLGVLASNATSQGSPTGGTGGDVTVTNDFTLTTKGDYAHGLVALSSGAGGGVYEWTKDTSFTWGDTNIASNTSGAVTVTNTGTIETYGVDSHGLVALSVGGGGGLLTSSQTLATDSYDAVTKDNAQQVVGGASSGAHAAAVTVSNSAAITTHGGYASFGAQVAAQEQNSRATDVPIQGGIAILAQSIGGGGGNNTGKGAIGGIGGVGDNGGSGSNGDAVKVTNSGALTTSGAEAHGIVAQSIGGGGGTGRNSKGLFLTVGGNGGSGGDGGEAYVENTAAISLGGDYAIGITAQSIGGGGGHGGQATAWGLFTSAAIGGAGGPGGTGGETGVHVSGDGAITTAGASGTGILVQSVGGGGGTGGTAKSNAAGLTFSMAFAAGGTGGSGGDGQKAWATHAGKVNTSGADATGLIVQSIGGGGGAGGGSSAGSLAIGVPLDEKGDTFALSSSFSLGGNGGDGGSGGEARAIIENGGSITTSGDGALGISAQSLGGGGGAGGDSTASAGTATLQSLISTLSEGQAEVEGSSITVDLTLALGGSGAKGGNGGQVYVHDEGSITTSGKFAHGVLAQSVGGGGGSSGTSETNGVNDFGSSAFSLSFALGATGGAGGTGGKVQAGVSGHGHITTSGTTSHGIVAQSVGGGGGSAGGGTADVDAETKVNLGFGATGGTGGDGGDVYAWNNGAITTSGDGSIALVAQSIGGGGGTGGSGTSSIGHATEFKKETKTTFKDWLSLKPGVSLSLTAQASLGASGGAGGDGGQVVVGNASIGGTVSEGKTTTHGSFSHGVLAQSIGGGGGHASSSGKLDGGVTTDGSEIEANVATLHLGATTGSGGAGGKVLVYAGETRTYGFSAHGVVAQSVGGGGGHMVQTGYAAAEIDLKFGGTNGDGVGRAGGEVEVYVTSAGGITTSGDGANGVMGQSIGGGGGIAGIALGTYDTVNDDTVAGVISVTLGSGSSAGSAYGGAVSLLQQATIQTSGTRAIGLVGQSIGGGGGFVTAAAGSFDQVATVGDQAINGADDVTVALEGDSVAIITTGDGAWGILAQSVAGGGGVAADTAQRLQAVYGLSTQDQFYNAIKLSNGNCYNAECRYRSFNYGGDDTQANAHTSGDLSVSIGASSGIMTEGKYAHGIVAQSIAGGGGILTVNGNTYAGTLALFNNEGYTRDAQFNTSAGSVSIDISGMVTVEDDTSWGVWAQATGSDITLQIDPGGSLSGSKAGATSGGYYLGGAAYATGANRTSVTLTNNGTLSGNVVKHDFTQALGAASPAADGRVSLDLSAAPGESLLLNGGSGVFETGAIVGTDRVLNAGTLDIGGRGRVQTTRFTGDLAGLDTTGGRHDAGALGTGFTALDYREDGQLRRWRSETTSRGGLISGLDVDMAAGLSDRILVEGDLSGAWGIDVNAATLLPGVRVEFLKVAGADLSEITLLSSAVFDYGAASVSDTGWTGFEVQAADFTAGGMLEGRNARQVAGALQAAWDGLADGSLSLGAPLLTGSGSGGDDVPVLAEVFAAVGALETGALSGTLASMGSQVAAVPLAVGPSAAAAAASSVLSCPEFGEEGVMLREGSCAWGRMTGGWTDQRADGDSAGYEGSAFGVQAGLQHGVGDGWTLGGGLGWEKTWYRDGSGREKLDAQSVTGTLALKKETGPWLFGLVAGLGYTWGTSERSIDLGTRTARAEGDPEAFMIFGRARAAYELPLAEAVYLRPRVDLDVINLQQRSYRESGAGALNLEVQSGSETVFGLTPALELGARLPLGEGALPLRIFADVGFTLLSEQDWTTRARFAGQGAGQGFSSYTAIADRTGNVTAGIDLQDWKGLTLKLQYGGSFADGYQAHSGSLRLGYRF